MVKAVSHTAFKGTRGKYHEKKKERSCTELLLLWSELTLLFFAHPLPSRSLPSPLHKSSTYFTSSTSCTPLPQRNLIDEAKCRLEDRSDLTRTQVITRLGVPEKVADELVARHPPIRDDFLLRKAVKETQKIHKFALKKRKHGADHDQTTGSEPVRGDKVPGREVCGTEHLGSGSLAGSRAPCARLYESGDFGSID